ncbi:hypothetical protein [Pseudolactococcus insecticola]|uniref:Antirestriction protein ArdA n=1 Tax=Pseudolactococcus insecticola TaxID=2709158 RepID=A0A6A0B929_9LACT|nr:hypothetical protein [Lactococcus insecticola]GFH40824.1 hypothetical protein Hs20B_12220 [Lactococcus insecticola]
MKVNVYEMIMDDKFYIDLYHSDFSQGRWFTAEELARKKYSEVMEEYLGKYNPNEHEELELGVFDIDNESGLWRGEYLVGNLMYNLAEIYRVEYFDVDADIYEFSTEFFEDMGLTAMDVATKVASGNIKSWNDPYIGFDDQGNFVTYSETEYKEELLERARDLSFF